MAASILESLELRGVVVLLQGELAVFVRPETSAASVEGSGAFNSMRHRSPRPEGLDGQNKDAAGAYGSEGVLPGIGRSRRLLSLLTRWFRTTLTRITPMWAAVGPKALAGC